MSVDLEELDVKVKSRNRSTLKGVRNARRRTEQQPPSTGHSTLGIQEDGYADGPSDGPNSEIRELDSGSREAERVADGHGERVRQTNGTTEHTIESSDTLVRESEEDHVAHPAINLEAERQRKRELDRQRKARKRAEDKQAASVKSEAGQEQPDARFTLKRPIQGLEDVKVFTQKEAEETLEKLVFVYQRGSELLDDVLEIVVKGHEKVQIWALSEDEARMLATMHMEKAKKEKASARTVRALINIYDRMYLWMLIGPRMVATGQHVKKSGGLSLR